ncbi:hypothetical protein HPP92_005472 [Vanilla planifolia]|uniref:Uncharacterized protein n=1 Tax=Vanilla planifolia TaxID=51239 RepID=A0A835RYU8_VANPL|nr:hypothetical protein HPP92_005472 [Vanilla planifolia]
MPMSSFPEFCNGAASGFPYMSPPRTFGQPFNHRCHYFSAPASPSRTSAGVYKDLYALDLPSPAQELDVFEDDDVSFEFAINFRSMDIAAADELFDKGQIRPLQAVLAERGRELRSLPSKHSRSGRKGSRSLSPTRAGDELFVKETTDPSPDSTKAGGSRKWPRLKNLFLFRNASEGRANSRGSRDLLRKYALLSSSFSKKKEREERKSGVAGGVAANRVSVRRGRGAVVSAHEMHYMANRAAAEEQRKRTPLPYRRQGLLGLITYKPAVRGMSKDYGCSSFSCGRL